MKFLLMFAASSAALSVLLGAFGAHALKTLLTENSLGYFHTAVQYQMTHSLAMLAFLVFYSFWKNEWLIWGARSFAFGIIFFSGSLYTLALTNLKWVGPITPLGGLCFIAGWVCLLVAAYEYEN
ncbi:MULTISPECIES: DUF423 domain-containing protein [Aliiglaciecola]|uniref:DUF423 domain-containing protein n=1 Tax=Aliiglaciecola TaxID=1406885 RepID=UPI001C081688|nr:MULTISPECIES: DUF423 domain-containing protein [Aliiglaciecola]MBU2880044.1 DUF423 domain-containing protein [Aliiglaciecola lipolytica]MDO6710958.1 DUF423 domain-containing protein [Aliiglaciecola sp. 2_MG-2023]MDO6752439.1 DUF423 domain-containing protein [Aliiglaciecola sp. 1_MG-2023]